MPVIDYGHELGKAAVGGCVYRGSHLSPLEGSYLYGDNTSGRVWALEHDNFTVVSNREIAHVPSLSSFGEDEQGELYAVSLAGKIFVLQQATLVPTSLPARLSETGLFKDTADLIAEEPLFEYDLNLAHWTDGAQLRRWIRLPESGQIHFRDPEPWTFPVGTIFVQHFEIELVAGDPDSVDRLETRVLRLTEDGWAADTYRWNDEGTDAQLLLSSDTEELTIQDGDGERTQEWYYPGRSDCSQCHNAGVKFVLGVDTRQLNRDFDVPSGLENQLSSWNLSGFFSTDIGLPTDYPALPDFFDDTVAVSERARAYLEVNCAHCHHQGSSPTPDDMDLRYGVPLDAMALFDVRPTEGDLALPDAFRVKSGVKESSVLWERIRRLDDTRMPPLATRVVDKLAETVLGRWIDEDPGM